MMFILLVGMHIGIIALWLIVCVAGMILFDDAGSIAVTIIASVILFAFWYTQWGPP